MDPFVVLLGFAVLKIGIGLTLIWLGLRGGEGGRDDEEPFFPPEPEWEPPRDPAPMRVPARRRPVAAVARRGPVRSPSRTARRRERV